MASVRIEQKDLQKLATLAARFLEGFAEVSNDEPDLPGGGLTVAPDFVKRTNELLDHAVDMANHINQSVAAQRKVQ